MIYLRKICFIQYNNKKEQNQSENFMKIDSLWKIGKKKVKKTGKIIEK